MPGSLGYGRVIPSGLEIKKVYTLLCRFAREYSSAFP
jgi:hypothetical protein